MRLSHGSMCSFGTPGRGSSFPNGNRVDPKELPAPHADVPKALNAKAKYDADKGGAQASRIFSLIRSRASRFFACQR